MKIVEIVQTGPGPRFIVRVRGYFQVQLRTTHFNLALAKAKDICKKFGLLGLRSRVSYV